MNGMNHFPKAKGFTLIEFMIAVTIIGILFGLGIPSFRAWLQNAQIRTATESMQNGLQLARQEAVRRNTNVEFVLANIVPTTLNVNGIVPNIAGPHWVVRVLQPNNTYAFIQARSGLEGSPDATLANVPLGGIFIYNRLGRITTPPAPGAALTFTIQNPTGGDCQPAGPMRCLSVQIRGNGEARMCDPQLNLATNPQGCVLL